MLRHRQETHRSDCVGGRLTTCVLFSPPNQGRERDHGVWHDVVGGRNHALGITVGPRRTRLGRCILRHRNSGRIARCRGRRSPDSLRGGRVARAFGDGRHAPHRSVPRTAQCFALDRREPAPLSRTLQQRGRSCGTWPRAHHRSRNSGCLRLRIARCDVARPPCRRARHYRRVPLRRIRILGHRPNRGSRVRATCACACSCGARAHAGHSKCIRRPRAQARPRATFVDEAQGPTARSARCLSGASTAAGFTWIYAVPNSWRLGAPIERTIHT